MQGPSGRGRSVACPATGDEQEVPSLGIAGHSTAGARQQQMHLKAGEAELDAAEAEALWGEAIFQQSK